MREKGGGQTGLDEQEDWNVAKYFCNWTPRHGRQKSPFMRCACFLISEFQ
jgi:hypothetical protein